jgi:uncharacterized protein
MNKIELEIIALSHSITQSNCYAVVLGETNGLRRLPIVIGGPEAQAIAVVLERMPPSRPLTHDLVKTFMNAFNVTLKEVIINDLQEGVFFSKLICVSENDTVELDSRTSDAIALAVRYNCPIYTYEHILTSAGVILEGLAKQSSKPTTSFEADVNDHSHDLSKLPKEELEHLLEKVLENEDYIQAVTIRDELNRRK